MRRPIIGRLVLVAVLAIAAMSAGGQVIALVAGEQASPKGPVDPRTDPCAREGGICDVTAAAARAAANVEAQAPTGIVIYRLQAEAKARALALTPQTPEAPAAAVVYSVLLTRPELEAISHEGRNYAVNLARPVWVVTVHASIATSGSPVQPAKIVDVYSVALDAETGQWTDYCIGCEWLTASR